ncbi:MAG: hypothetical protein IJW79_11580 [Clostridia bacterium]|nr:hypothetical protein [Clostridia bacterium]
MKKILCFAIAIIMVAAFAACGSTQPKASESAPPKNTELDIIGLGYKVVYDVSDPNAVSIMSKMLSDIQEKLGAKPSSMNSGNPEAEYEIQLGLKSGRPQAERVYKEVEGYSNDDRSSYIIRTDGNKIVIGASDRNSLELAVDRLLGNFMSDSRFVVPTELDLTVVYDKNVYAKDRVVKELDAKAIGSNASLADLKVNGESVLGFSTDKTEYNVAVSFKTNLFVDAITSEPGASADVTFDGTKATITVKSINQKNERVYLLNAFQKVDSEIVNKNGADATVTYVIDDGDQATATFVLEKMAPKYPLLKASFALITNKLATLDVVTNEDGTKEYAKDEDGFYTYTKNQSAWEFWENAAKNKNFELVSHSHTHKYWGEDDNGGRFDYYNTAGEKFTSDDLPIGSQSKEFIASKQIIQDLDPSQPAAVFVRSGLTAGGKNVKYSDTFWDPIHTSGAYIGGRGTYTYPDTPRDMVNVFAEFDQSEVRNKLKSYMVQHYNTSSTVKTTQANSGPAECLSAGIPYWTDYIDTAVEMKGWAAFCIHTIRPDTHDTRSGHYIFQSQADALFAHSEKLAKENKVWIATLSEGMIYAIEWASAKVQAYVDGDSIEVSLTHDEEGEYFNMPLTVKIALPEGKTSASVGDTALKTFTESGKTYAYVDVTPGVSVSVKTK